MILENLAQWTPFRIDALGLVTVFGAEEISSNHLADPIPGFMLHDIIDGILATDIAAWFTRWLLCYPITYAATTIRLQMDGSPMPAPRQAVSVALGLLTAAPLVVFTSLMRDGWGIANFASMIITMAVRQLMVRELGLSIDKAIVVNCLLTDPCPPHPRFYSALRLAAWLAFGAHAVSLGMSTLFHQVLSVVILLLGTFLTSLHVGDRPATIGTRLRLDIDPGDPSWSRSPAYARLGLTETEEDYMVHWNLLPRRANTVLVG
ncbi:hypothetical protein DL765_007261 [Monosporascus sp. GIB2]|nr:hypothetical protein DL765_007261 [Monosporascus sp. GIB2]